MYLKKGFISIKEVDDTIYVKMNKTEFNRLINFCKKMGFTELLEAYNNDHHKSDFKVCYYITFDNGIIIAGPFNDLTDAINKAKQISKKFKKESKIYNNNEYIIHCDFKEII